MMRRKTQGIPGYAARLLPARGRLTAHHWRRFLYGMGPRFASTRLPESCGSGVSRLPAGVPSDPGRMPPCSPRAAADEATARRRRTPLHQLTSPVDAPR